MVMTKNAICTVICTALIASLSPALPVSAETVSAVLSNPYVKTKKHNEKHHPANEAKFSTSDKEPALSEDQRIAHLVDRIGFGAAPGQIAEIRNLGIEQYINQQLNPESVPENPQVQRLIDGNELLQEKPQQLMLSYSRNAIQARAQANGEQLSKKELQMRTGQERRQSFQKVAEAKILTDVGSTRQLQAVMTDFWFNHFNISINKGMDHFLVGAYEQQAIRPYALGHFRDLLEATCHHPAMLFYLDNWQNTAPNSNGARGRFKGINENYARELMELHTLGVNGGYTQQDVVALAHILTGLSFPNEREIRMGRAHTDQFDAEFYPQRHDFSDKVFLGKTISGTGEEEIEQALDILAASPATAHHISFQLAQYFVSDNPPESLVDKLTQRYLKTNGDIKAIMSTLLHSPEFWSAASYDVKFKSPYRYVISAIRSSGLPVADTKRIAALLKQLGEPLYGCLTPDGYKNTQDAWLNSDGILKRIAFATQLTTGSFDRRGGSDGFQRHPQLEAGEPAALPGSASSFETPAMLEKTTGKKFSSSTQAAIEKAPDRLKAAMVLGSPEFMRY